MGSLKKVSNTNSAPDTEDVVIDVGSEAEEVKADCFSEVERKALSCFCICAPVYLTAAV